MPSIPHLYLVCSRRAAVERRTARKRNEHEAIYLIALATVPAVDTRTWSAGMYTVGQLLRYCDESLHPRSGH